jgi:hypothetical protein
MNKSKPTKSAENRELTGTQQILLEKYKLLVTQIIHWDTHFWNKSKFFLTIETALLGTIGAILSPSLKGKIFESVTTPYLTIILALFNVFLCYVWHRTNKRNLQYRQLKIDEFVAIERLMPELNLFSADSVKMMIPNSGRSARWEMSLPFAFALLWCLVLGWQCRGT